MIKLVALFLILFSASVLAQNPSKPVWPKEFSTGVEVDEWNGRREPHFLRWFYSVTVNKDRFDGVGVWRDEYYYNRVVFDHVQQKEYFVVHQPELVACFVMAINTTLPKPNFENVEYRGTELIDYQLAYRWRENIPDRGITFEYYDSVASREPLRIDVIDERRRTSNTWKFRGFDACTQSPDVFNISPEIQAICNNA
eukprot:TRINITY_DN16848_c0_g1_i1.p1 TRINITY_DN16848_c0_g1~~TRINITY_DN16848_c0_g1_i1.p1  ORF type:complete len:197 (-),score=38.18 TRINITY_DN16848_c0_g1_i1:34-624(-)